MLDQIFNLLNEEKTKQKTHVSFNLAVFNVCRPVWSFLLNSLCIGNLCAVVECIVLYPHSVDVCDWIRAGYVAYGQLFSVVQVIDSYFLQLTGVETMPPL